MADIGKVSHSSPLKRPGEPIDNCVDFISEDSKSEDGIPSGEVSKKPKNGFVDEEMINDLNDPEIGQCEDNSCTDRFKHVEDDQGGDSDTTSSESEDGASEISDLSSMSGAEWRQMAGPISWVQHQMTTGTDPRNLLAVLMGEKAKSVPQEIQDFDLWKLIIELLSEPPKRKKLDHVNTMDHVIELLRTSKKVIVLTGAGVSVSCGIPDFRSRDGIYARLAIDFPDLPDPQAMFGIDYFCKDPRPFFKFAKEIYPGQFEPSYSHKFIKLIEDHGKLLRNYTQNIDTLEQVAGIHNVIQCHGSFATASCMTCKYKVDADVVKEDIMNQVIPKCPKCPPEADFPVMKPDIVFFGEGLPAEFHSQMAEDRQKCDLLIVIGSSLKVRPVALIPNSIQQDVPQILINREPLGHLNFDVELLGDCDVIVAELCRRLGEDWDQLSIESKAEPLREVTWDEILTTPLTPPTPPVSENSHSRMSFRTQSEECSKMSFTESGATNMSAGLPLSESGASSMSAGLPPPESGASNMSAGLPPPESGAFNMSAGLPPPESGASSMSAGLPLPEQSNATNTSHQHIEELDTDEMVSLMSELEQRVEDIKADSLTNALNNARAVSYISENMPEIYSEVSDKYLCSIALDSEFAFSGELIETQRSTIKLYRSPNGGVLAREDLNPQEDDVLVKSRSERSVTHRQLDGTLIRTETVPFNELEDSDYEDEDITDSQSQDEPIDLSMNGENIMKAFWRAKERQSLAKRLPDHCYLFLEPNRYVFPGAEVDQTSRNLQSGSDSDSDDCNEASSLNQLKPDTENGENQMQPEINSDSFHLPDEQPAASNSQNVEDHGRPSKDKLNQNQPEQQTNGTGADTLQCRPFLNFQTPPDEDK